MSIAIADKSPAKRGATAKRPPRHAAARPKQLFRGLVDSPLVEMARRAEQSFKAFISPAQLFEGLGFNYIGPIDGHDLAQLTQTFENARDIEDNEHPLLIHCRTEKGYGYEFPEPKVRINAIRALGRLGGARARRTLERAARDLDSAISLAAERALAAWPHSDD